MDRLLGDFFGPRLFDRSAREELGWPPGEGSLWPELEVSQRGSKLVVQVEAPGSEQSRGRRIKVR